MADQRMTFVLEGRDRLSRTLNDAGVSAGRLAARINDTSRRSTVSLAAFTRDANGRLRDLNGQFVTAAQIVQRSLDEQGDAAQRAQRRITTATRATTVSVTRATRDLSTQLRDAQGRFVTTARVAGDSMGDTADSADRMAARVRTAAGDADDSVSTSVTNLNSRLRDSRGRFLGVGDAAGSMGGRMARLVPSAGALGGALNGVGMAAAATALPAMGALIPMLAGGVLAAQTAKLAFSGVGEAVTLAGEDSKAYAEALKKMGPEQRAFTKTLVAGKKEFAGLGREVQKIVLPSFTQALKDARPLVDSVKGGVRQMAGVFAQFGTDFGKLFASGRFKSALEANFSLGAGFFRQLSEPLTTLTQSVLDFGAASKPTLDAFGQGIGGLLGKGIPGFLAGLQGGIKGSAAMFDGLFNAINKVLPALGELVGSIARSVGPSLKGIFEAVGTTGAGAFRFLAGAIRFLKPLFGEVAGAVRVFHTALSTVGLIAKQVGEVVMTSLWPSFREAENARGPLQRLADWLEGNKAGVLEFTRVASNGIIDFVGVVVGQLPNVITGFRWMATGVLTALDGIVSGLAVAFDGVPILGEKFQKANTAFDKFKDGFISGLHDAEDKSRDFADKVLPRLEQNKLRMNITNWNAQIATAKAKLSDKNLPKEKRARLTADIRDWTRKTIDAGLRLQRTPAKKTAWLTGNIKDWKAKVSSAEKQLKTAKGDKRAKLTADITAWRTKVSEAEKRLRTMKSTKEGRITARNATGPGISAARRALNSVRDKTVNITTHYRVTGSTARRSGSFGAQLRARGGPVGRFAAGGPVQGFPGGGEVVGPGSPTSDDVPILASNGEFVIRAASVARYGRQFMHALNEGRLGSALRGSGGGRSGGDMAGAGSDMMRGLITGMRSMGPSVMTAARQMAGGALAGVRDELQIASPSKKMRELAREAGRGMISGLTGSREKIASTAKGIAKDIWAAFSGSKDNRLVAMLNRGTAKLQAAAKKRDSIAATIARAKEFAENTRVGAKKAASLSSMFGGDQEEVSAAAIQGRLAQRLAKMRTFTSYIKALAKRGLNKTMLREILEMGPEEGYAYASALTGANASLFRAINSTQYKVNAQAESLGRAGGDALYDAGKNASRGFLTGLQTQQKAIERYMLTLAKGMQKSIRRALGIRSPSTVMAEIGRYSTEGLALGLLQRVPALDSALETVSGRVSSVRPVVARPAAAAAVGKPAQVQIDVHGAVDPIGTAKAIRKVLLELKRTHGVNINLGVA